MKVLIIFILAFSFFMLIFYLLYYKHTARFIKQKTNIKCLGYVPLNNNSRYLIIQNDLKTNIIEYIKDIRQNLLNCSDLKAFSIISCYPEEGKSWIANNLAVSLARINKKVLLIDANLRKVSNKSEIFYTNKVEGLSDFIRNIDLENNLNNLQLAKKYIEQTQIPNLYILQNGTITFSSAEFIKSKKMDVLLNLLKEIYDYLIIDGTSFFENSDCLALSSKVDSNILVIENKEAIIKHLQKVKNSIEKNNGKILGFILNKTNLKTGKYYGKQKNSKLGVYIESSTQDESMEMQNLNTLINPVQQKLEKENSKQFNLLQKELNENIMIEDFINDIEVNFNLKLDTINQNTNLNKQQILNLSTKLDESSKALRQNFTSILNTSKEQYYIHDLAYKQIIKIIENLQYEISEIKNTQLEQINELKAQIESKNFNENFEELKFQIESQNTKQQIAELELKLKYTLKEIALIQESIENTSEHNNEDINQNNIINIEKLYNKNSDIVSFSIDEPIPYEELEELAFEIIDLNPEEEIKETL